ncbi:unnamed protein product, partial [Meganyctiphanes norvegica]
MVHSQFGSSKDLMQRHGLQMIEIRRILVNKENQRQALQGLMFHTPCHSSPTFNEKILALFKQNSRIAHFCYTPLLFLPRWRWQIAATRDHTIADPNSPIDKTVGLGLRTPETRSRHDSGSSTKGSTCAPVTDLRRSLSNLSSPGQRRRNMTGGDDKWHGALCSNFLKEFIQYLQSWGFLTLTLVTNQNKGRTSGRDLDDRTGNRLKEVRFNEQLSRTYLIRNVLGGTLLLEIAFSEPYFYTK